MGESKTEVQLKAKATNWLLSALIAVVSWIGRQQYEALQQIKAELENISGTVQVHTAEISNLKKTTSDLLGFVYEKQFALHEENYQLPKRKK